MINDITNARAPAAVAWSALFGHICVVLSWLLKWPILYVLEIVCVINVASLVYLNLCPNDPMNIPSLKLYLIMLNSYAFGSILFKAGKYVIRRHAGSHRQDDGYHEEHGNKERVIAGEGCAYRPTDADAIRCINWRNAKCSTKSIFIELKKVYAYFAYFACHKRGCAEWPNDQAHRSAPGGDVERKGNDGKTN